MRAAGYGARDTLRLIELLLLLSFISRNLTHEVLPTFLLVRMFRHTLCVEVSSRFLEVLCLIADPWLLEVNLPWRVLMRLI